MKWMLILAFCGANALCAQDADAFARALERKSPRALDRWMKRELHDHRKGTRITSQVAATPTTPLPMTH